MGDIAHIGHEEAGVEAPYEPRRGDGASNEAQRFEIWENAGGAEALPAGR